MQFGKPKRRPLGGLRRSQLLTTAGPGAIVDMPSESVVIAGLDYWKNADTEENTLSERNLERYLGVDYFVEPPPKASDRFRQSSGIPAFRFPRWMFCPSCKRLAPDNSFGFSASPKCASCRSRLIPSRFVTACEKGHLDDFPYVWWVHSARSRERCENPFLEIRVTGRSSGLDSLLIKCRCGAEKSMAGCFGREALKGLKCRGKRPWLDDSEECTEQIRTLQRGATNLYYPITASALSIPPWSSAVRQELGRRQGSLKPLISNPSLFKQVIKQYELPEILRCSAEEITRQAQLQYIGETSAGQLSWQDLIEDEHRAFMDKVSDEDGEFKIHQAEVPLWLDSLFDTIILATRLREVVALKGFRRIHPDTKEDNSYARISKKHSNWLPGMELLGEGIFVSLDKEKIREWERHPRVISRYERISRSMDRSVFRNDILSPRYILLHTLSHLLIRQLVLECGYATAAVKERIYSTFTGDQDSADMSAVLIYTATNDSEGSLGGLVREGRPERFENLFRKMLENASWCSSDPICLQSVGQGVDSLNLAACHACSLLPETSCEASNCYLDRAMLIGELDSPETGFFHALLTGESK